MSESPFEIAHLTRQAWSGVPNPYHLHPRPLDRAFPVVFAVCEGAITLGHLTVTRAGVSYSSRPGTPGLADAIDRVRDALAALRGEGL